MPLPFRARMLRAFAALAAAAVLALAPRAANAAEPYDIHVIATITGPSAFVGQYMKLNFDAFEDWVNQHGGIDGRPLHFIYDDDQSQPQVAVQLASNILASHPAALMVTGPVANCAAVVPLTTNGPVMWCNSPALHPKKGSYDFASGPDTFDGINAVLRYYRMKGWTKIGVLNTTDVTGQDADKAIAADLKLPENKAIKVVAYEHFTPSDLTVSAQMARIKAAGAEALIAWCTGSPVATVFKGMIQAGLDVPVAPTGGNEVFQQLAEYKSFLPKRLVMASALFPPHDGVLKLDPRVEKVQHEMYAILKKHGFKADNNTADTWDAALITVAGLRKLGPKATAKELRDWILSLRDFAGINGIYDFEKYPERGLSHDSSALVRYDPTGPDGAQWQWVSEIGGAPLPAK
jgi:branched-chain amino acid transport system substrate-binding protein